MPGRANASAPASYPEAVARAYTFTENAGLAGRAAAAGSLPMSSTRNRILMLCTALGDKDTPQWPFWKWQHIKATRGVTEFAMLAVTREDSFIATLKDGETSMEHLGNGRRNVEPELLKSFLDRFYRPGSYFVYGGHGVSDRIEFNSHHRMQVHELAACFGSRRFLGILFDACLMSSLDTAYYLRKNTPFIGASEGYMWEEDTWAENHMFNPYSASLMARDVDGFRVLRLIGEEYTRKSHMADYTVIDTSKAEALWDRVMTHHSPQMNASIQLKPEVASGDAPIHVAPSEADRVAKPPVMPTGLVPAPDFPPAITSHGRMVPRDHRHRYNFHVPNSLYPDDVEDDHIVDLGCFLRDDPDTMELFNAVVAWRANPRADDVYDAEMHGLNYAFSQYALESFRRKVPRDLAAVITARYQQAALESEADAAAADDIAATPENVSAACFTSPPIAVA
jgi:hypothetical protein